MSKSIGCLSVIEIFVFILIIAASLDVSNNGAKKDVTAKALDTSLSVKERIEYAAIGGLG